MWFYFGTSSKKLENIKVKGLINPCITDNVDLAHFYAQEITEELGGVEVIFQIKITDSNYSYKENRKFKYKGKILPCNIKMIEGPEFKKRISAEEVFSLISKHHTNPDDLLENKFQEIYVHDYFVLKSIEVSMVQCDKEIDTGLVLDYLDLNLDECPPIVVMEKDGKYQVVDGDHRVATFLKAKKHSILAYLPE